MKMGITRFKCVPSFSLLFHFTINIFFLFENSVCSQLPPTQKSTMVNLSELLHDQTPSILWNISTDPCSWTGVTCTYVTNINSSIITKLTFSNFGLTNSSFIPLACQIDSIEALDFSMNLLSTIPNGFFTSCSEIQGLKLVNFSSNTVSGPLPSFPKGFAQLESLDLSNNSLTGSIGMQLNRLVGLRSLNLSFNELSGFIPTELGKFMGLEQLQLSANMLQGPIPEQLADCKNLTILNLSLNKLTGNIPFRIGELSRIKVLILSLNFLTGEVHNIISNLTTLQRFAANQNYFSGNIPPGISRFLKNLDLSYNNLDGLIPNDLLSQPNLQTVDLSSNKLVGLIPYNISSSLVRLRLGSNSLNGSILPINFGGLQNLVYLELENNILSGSIPSNLGSCPNLRLLNLAGNKLSGELPTELGNLTALQVLSLQVNNFVGEIPREITQLSNLLTMNISWNSLTGSIPPTISSLTKLEYLHLQGNYLSGLIPRNIGDINSLIELQLGKNYLSGYIPTMPRNLQYALNISNNLFEERIPESFDQLTSLQILDISNNRFYGEIPKFLADMPSFTTLLLNNNNLSGFVPTFRRSVFLDTEGNYGLIIKPPLNTNPVPSHRKRTIAVVFSAALFGALVAILLVFISVKLLYRARVLEVKQEDQDSYLSQAIETRLLTTNSFHKSNINFNRAIEAVAEQLNSVLKTKFSTYYEVVMPSGISYFAKKINRSDMIFQLANHENFGKQLEALGKVNSSNIMTPLAYMLATDSAYLFYEMAFKGTLFDVLHRSSGVPLDWASRCSIAVGVAQGLASLHGCSSGPILLFDLSSKTIMLKSLKEPQIGDIELCKVIDPSKSTSSLSTVAGSIGYIPPEYAYTMRVTMAGNVYSFGVILLELLTGKQAVSGGTELAKTVLSNSAQPQKWDMILDFRISRTSVAGRSQMLAVLKIALACINASSKERPKMKTVLRMLLNAR